MRLSVQERECARIRRVWRDCQASHRRWRHIGLAARRSLRHQSSVLIGPALGLLGVALIGVRWEWTGVALVIVGLFMAVLMLAAGETEARR